MQLHPASNHDPRPVRPPLVALALVAGLPAVALLQGCGAPPERARLDLAEVVARREGRAAPDAHVGALTLSELRAIAVREHPALVLARRLAEAPRAEAGAARRWSGPTLGLDLERIVTGAANPLEWAALVGVGLPLGGAFEARARALEAEALVLEAAADVTTFEHLRALDERYADAVAADREVAALELHRAALEALVAKVELAEGAGALEIVEGDLVRLARVDESRRAGAASDAREAALDDLARLAGLGARARDVGAALELALPGGPPPAAAAAPASGVHDEAPPARHARALFELAEAALEQTWREGGGALELALGPGGRDDESFVGLGLAVPLRRADRGGLARVRIERDLAVGAYGVAYEAQLDAVARAAAARRRALREREALAEVVLPLAEAQVTRLERLGQLGELRVLVALEAHRALLDARLDHARLLGEEWRAALDEASWTRPLPAPDTAPNTAPAPAAGAED